MISALRIESAGSATLSFIVHAAIIFYYTSVEIISQISL